MQVIKSLDIHDVYKGIFVNLLCNFKKLFGNYYLYCGIFTYFVVCVERTRRGGQICSVIYFNPVEQTYENTYVLQFVLYP